jgi:transcriptional regulator with XRE-family HTH domain
LKQAELERRAGLAHNYISRVETGDVRNPRPDNLERIATVFGISVDALHLKSPGHGVIDEPAGYDAIELVDRLESLPGPKRAAVVAAFYSLLEQIESDDD